MANMSYCRFRNTLMDLQDCYEHMDDNLSEEEAQDKKILIKICCEIAQDHGHEVDVCLVEEEL